MFLSLDRRTEQRSRLCKVEVESSKKMRKTSSQAGRTCSYQAHNDTVRNNNMCTWYHSILLEAWYPLVHLSCQVTVMWLAPAEQRICISHSYGQLDQPEGIQIQTALTQGVLLAFQPAPGCGWWPHLQNMPRDSFLVYPSHPLGLLEIVDRQQHSVLSLCVRQTLS